MLPTTNFPHDASTQRLPSPNEQELLPHDPTYQSYHDSPTRDIMSPPPQYTSPEPPPTLSRPSKSASHVETPERRPRSFRDSSRELYTDESPPPPPPHRQSLTRSVGRNSIAYKSAEDVNTATRFQDMRPSREHSDQVTHETYPQDNNISTGRAMQPSVPSLGHRIDQLQGSDPHLQRPMPRMPERTSYSSNNPFATGTATPRTITPVSTPDFRSSRYSGRSIPLEDYSSPSHHPMAPYYNDSPYHDSIHHFDPTISDASINPYNIADDGDDGFMPNPSKRKSALPLHKPYDKNMSAPTGVAGATAAGGVMGGLFGRKPKNQVASGTYGPVDGTNGDEKRGWLAQQKKGNRKMRLIVGIAIGLVIVLAIIAGVVGGVLGTHESKASSGSGNINNANDDTAANGDLDLNSAEIKKLLNNNNLHKVFPGMDYTPWGVQYPLCLTYPPSQNNVTRDMAVLSQLTNNVRLYGTDCNQTEMVLHAIDRLQLKDMKVWLGVWIDQNQTTTDRQMSQMYKILEEVKDKSIFKGAIIGNEALYRANEDKAQSKQELITLLTDTRSNFSSLGYDIPIATSDLGDNWTADLVAVSDYVMSNIHPFFAGVTADVAAAWTWNFWQQKDVPLTTGTNVKQIISETGWPSGGGTDCGGADGSCAVGQSGSVASIDNMNIFMNDWVCQALANGTEYFWFEAFDEAWKIQYNTPTQAWEDKWGLMDSARNLKNGIKIPDCGGQTVSS